MKKLLAKFKKIGACNYPDDKRPTDMDRLNWFIEDTLDRLDYICVSKKDDRKFARDALKVLDEALSFHRSEPYKYIYNKGFASTTVRDFLYSVFQLTPIEYAQYLTQFNTLTWKNVQESLKRGALK